MSKMSITSHWHLIKDKKKAVGFMKKLAPRFIRVSSLQKEICTKTNASDLHQLVKAGLRILPVCGSDRYGLMSAEQWTNYCRKFANYLKVMGTVNGENPVVQILNEPNTSLFTYGNPSTGFPSARLAWDRFRIAYNTIKNEFPGAIIIAPGLTNENKNGSNKIAARDFLEDWCDFGADQYLDYWALHYYDTDTKYVGTLRGNISFLKTNSRRPIAITETGSASDHAGWYSRIKNGIEGISPDFVAWYVFNGHAGFELYSNSLQSKYSLHLDAGEVKERDEETTLWDTLIAWLT